MCREAGSGCPFTGQVIFGVELDQAFADLGWREGLGEYPSVPGELVAQGRGIQKAHQSTGEGFLLARHHEAGIGGGDLAMNADMVRHDYRQTGGHGLNGSHPEVFRIGGQDKDIGLRHGGLLGVSFQKTGPYDIGFQPQVTRLAAKPLDKILFSGAAQHQGDVRDLSA